MTTPEVEPRFLSPETMTPTEVEIPCPVCGKKRAFDFLQIEEDDSGCYSVVDEHRFDQCEECGENIDYGAVSLRPAAETK